MAQTIVRWIVEFTEQNRAIRVVMLMLIYAATVALCFWTAYQLRFDFDVPPRFQAPFLFVALVAISAKLVGLLKFHQFDGLLTFFGKPDLKRLAMACLVGSLPLAAMSVLSAFVSAPPRGVVLIDFVFCIVALSAVRLSFWHVVRFLVAANV
jgi:FlaA1/EpsC-like NDP-sugar epimerase